MKTLQILVCLFTLSCNPVQSPKTIFTIKVDSGKFQKLTIFKYDFDLGKKIEFETLSDLSQYGVYTITDQIFEPSIYTVKLDTGKEVRIVVEQNGPINLQLNDEISVESEVAAISDFKQHLEELNKRFFAGMVSDFDKAMKENDLDRIAELEKEKDEVLVKFMAAMENTVREMGPSALAYDALSFFDLSKNRKFLNEMSKKFRTEYPDSGMSKALRARLAKADQFAIGRKAPIFKALNMKGEMVDLTNLKGSYVLLDFWASWCRPCRVENPKLVNLYKDYRDIKFDILGISIDSDVSLLQKAIEKDLRQNSLLLPQNQHF